MVFRFLNTTFETNRKLLFSGVPIVKQIAVFFFGRCIKVSSFARFQIKTGMIKLYAFYFSS